MQLAKACLLYREPGGAFSVANVSAQQIHDEKKFVQRRVIILEDADMVSSLLVRGRAIRFATYSSSISLCNLHYICN